MNKMLKNTLAASFVAVSLSAPAFAGAINAQIFEICKMGEVKEIDAALKSRKIKLKDTYAKNGETPLIIMAEWNILQDSMARMLKEKVDLEERDNRSFTPLLAAAYNNENHEVADLLCKKGANVHAATTKDIVTPEGITIPKGATPLMLAARFTNPETMRVLLKYGAATGAKDSRGRDIRDYARESRDPFNIEETEKIYAAGMK